MREQELLEYFLLEAEEHLASLHKGIAELDPGADCEALIEDIFRAAHTLKGSAAIVKLNVTSAIAHRMEDILEAIKDREIALSLSAVELVTSMTEAISSIVSGLSKGMSEPEDIVDGFVKQAEEFLARERVSAAEEPAAAVSAPALHRQAPSVQAAASERSDRRKAPDDGELYYGNFIRIDIQKIETMLNLIGEVTIKKNFLVQRSREAQDIIEEITFAGNRLLKEVGDFSERYAYSYSPQDSGKFADIFFTGFGELEFDRYDESNIFSRKLQEITNDIHEGLKQLSRLYETYTQDVRAMDHDIRMLRSDISETRMIPVGRLFQRFNKAVKEMARAHGKRAELKIQGGDTKIDRVVFERLFDPLMHIVRNAIAHGIEDAEARRELGKPEQGEIALSATQEGNVIVIQVRDDGRGIDVDRLRHEAIKRGMIRENDEVTKEELFGLIFHAGFSTRDDADMTSGRGIGMNAVRSQVSALSGVVEVDSEKDRFAVFKLHVPTTLAISNVVVFSSHNAEFAIPVTLMAEVTQLDIMDGLESGHGSINYRGRRILAKSIADFFGSSRIEDLLNKFVIICNISDKKVGIIVDTIVCQEETIIKPLNHFLDGLSIYSGMTISGDGKVRFVINPMTLFEADLRPRFDSAEKFGEDVSPKILIVDDSLSVRKYVANFVENQGYKALAASNGHEALNVLHGNKVDLVITDLEMPVMHGYELIRRVRSIEYLRDTPIIVLTSRGTKKHRQMALETGADDFLVKPFDEKALADVIARYVMRNV
ncbi:MAG: type IV pili sensor histidine kinase and response regulator [Nitrospirae bacterium]|nr:MAG: type IV pili sensor histidine kinase and response regulator [Nitrospirota bacterium]